jgi:tetratricopeptide (TPR) repeat protein
MSISPRHTIVLVTSIVMFTVCMPCVFPKSSGVDEFEKGLYFLHSQEPDKAISEFNKVISVDPQDGPAYYNRALAYTIKGDLGRAIADYRKARQLSPNNTLVYWGEGVVFSKESRWDQAISNYNRALGLDPDYAQLYYNRGLAFAKQGKLDSALLEFNKAIEIAPDYGAALHNRGVTYSRMGDLTQANIDFANAKSATGASLQKRTQNRSNIKASFDNTPEVVLEKQDFDRQGTEEKSSQDIAQSNKGSYFNRGIIYSRVYPVPADITAGSDTKDQSNAAPQEFAPQQKAAQPSYPEEVNTSAREAEAYCNRGVLCGQNGNISEAIDYFNKAIESNPKMALAYYNRGVAYFLKQDYDKAWIDTHMAKFLGFEIDKKFLTDLKQASNREK